MSLFDELKKAFPALSPQALRSELSLLERRVGALAPGAIQNAVDSGGSSQFGKSNFSLGSPFTEIALDLSDSDLNSASGRSIAVPGEFIYYKRQGSNPVGRLQISAAGTLYTLGPGAILKVPFSTLTFKTEVGALDSSIGVQAGASMAFLIAGNSPEVEYYESPAAIGGLQYNAVPLYNSGTYNYSVVPGQANGMPFANVTGWNRVGTIITPNGAIGTVTFLQYLAIGRSGSSPSGAIYANNALTTNTLQGALSWFLTWDVSNYPGGCPQSTLSNIPDQVYFGLMIVNTGAGTSFSLSQLWGIK